MKNYIYLIFISLNTIVISSQNLKIASNFNNGEPILAFGTNETSSIPEYSYSITKISTELGKVLISGNSGIKRFNNNGSIDNTFNANNATNSYVRDFIYTRSPISSSPTRYYIVAGDFTSFNGSNKKYIVAIDKNGNLFEGFNFPTFNGSIKKIINVGGKYIVIGDFNIFANNKYYTNIVRLNSDGSLDTTFRLELARYNVILGAFCTGNEFYLYGNLTSINGVTVKNIVRINYSNLTIDNSFNPQQNADNTVNCFILDNDKIYIGLNGNTNTVNLKKLNLDGSLSLDFQFNQNTVKSYNVRDIVKLNDSYVLVGDFFENFNTPVKIVCIKSDGSIKSDFTIEGKENLPAKINKFQNIGNNIFYIAGKPLSNYIGGQVFKYIIEAGTVNGTDVNGVRGPIDVRNTNPRIER